MEAPTMGDPLVGDGSPLEVPQDDSAIIGCTGEKPIVRGDNELRNAILVALPVDWSCVALLYNFQCQCFISEPTT